MMRRFSSSACRPGSARDAARALLAPTLAGCAQRWYLPGTDKGVIRSLAPSIMGELDALPSLWAQYEAAAKRFGPDVALVCGVSGAARTFAQVHARSLLYAQLLQFAMRALPGDVIILVSPNCLDFPSIFYGAIAVGVTVTPVNPTLTPDELKKTVLLAGPRVRGVFVHEMFKATATAALGLLQVDRPATITRDDLRGNTGEAPAPPPALPDLFVFNDNSVLTETYPSV
jgi:acyl-CoA synthetase (AMP-forming)/AMP-acid ligase II